MRARYSLKTLFAALTIFSVILATLRIEIAEAYYTGGDLTFARSLIVKLRWLRRPGIVVDGRSATYYPMVFSPDTMEEEWD